MPTRTRHRRALLRDADALHALAVAAVALLGSGGLLYLWYVRHVRQIARNASVEPALADAGAILVFGKHSRDGTPDPDFRARIERARLLVHQRADLPLLLLGGGVGPTEAEIAARELRAGALPPECELILEHESRDTLQNLRQARHLLQARGDGAAVLVSNRYHLARCALFARTLGVPFKLCAAETSIPSGPGAWRPELAEAAYLMWIDLGQRWARLWRNQRMLDRLA